MKKDNNLKQAARWVAKTFGYKADTIFGRLVWYVFITCVCLIAITIVYDICNNVVDRIQYAREYAKTQRDEYLHDYSNQYVSPYVVYHDSYPSYLYNLKTEHRTIKGIHWICKSSDGDSIACYSTIEEHKRGYFNIFTGEEAIHAQYQKAWIFSEGVACVMDKGMLCFIDHAGKTVIDKKFPYGNRNNDYCFHKGLCIMFDDNGRFGLIDRQGNWVVEPQYYQIAYDTKGFWLVQDRDWNYGMLDAHGKELLPINYDNITIRHDDSCIFVRRLDHLNQLLDFECNVINPCDFCMVEKMEYVTDEYDEHGDPKSAAAHCLKYSTTEQYYGLMNRNGNVVTLPIYSSIKAIGPDRYHCKGPNGSVILDDKGREVVEKL